MPKIRIVDYKYNDGGRIESGFKGNRAGDCVVRATAIIMQEPYRDVYELYAYNNKKMKGKRTARDGMNPAVSSYTLKSLGYKPMDNYLRIPVDHAITVTEVYEQIGDCLIFIPRHALAIMNGTVHDTWDSRFKRQGRRVSHSPIQRVWAHPDRNPPIAITNEIDDPTTDANKNVYMLTISKFNGENEWIDVRNHKILAFDINGAKHTAKDFLYGFNLHYREQWHPLPQNKGLYKENDVYTATLTEAERGAE